MEAGECQMRIGIWIALVSPPSPLFRSDVLCCKAAKVNDPSTLQVIEKPWLSRSLVWLTQVTSSGVESYFLSTWLKLNRKISHWTQIFWDSSQKSDSSWANLTFTYSNTAIYLLHLFFPCSLNWDAANEQIEFLAIPYFDNHLFIIRVQ